ncbi:GvpL/GvpF family gas vesicle protein [Nocardioides mesophilus]|uniref:GvpL/GvpF family gas vesicle protein n=1 Tax=Nocardioides mesophilus TaxID=433659 RepID=A0A7G9R7H0_9ACTN|nr:GvpL/GvpF family gas vesicle protein [Nocardioides mesophilus]QNN51545.1 GvpL/GvpF family gas vesicle protein [Nocardioides mesophilus]
MSRGEGKVLHAYGVMDNVDVPLPGAGIADTPVDVLDLGPVAVVTGRLDGAEFGEARWEAQGRDPAWIAPLARRHHEVVQQLCSVDGVAVVPWRLPGIYADDAALESAVRDRLDDVLEVLDRVRGHAEWGLKVYLVDPGMPAAPAAPTSGRDYLRQRAAEAEARARGSAGRLQQVLEAYETVATVSARSVANAVQDEALTGRHEPMLLNSAHLVASGHEDAFFVTVREQAEMLSGAGMRLEVSGPWPPYNFTEPDRPGGEEE